MVKKNPNLTAEQKLVMFEDGTELPGTSAVSYTHLTLPTKA